MDILSANYLNTTTQMSISSGTLTASYLFNRNTNQQYTTDGFNNDLTTAALTINFDSTQTVSRIALLNTNIKAFDIYYNGATANTFAITSTGSTSTSQFSTNSETSLYIRTTAVDCTSVTIDMKSTQVADAEKAIGWLVLSNPLVNFEVDGRLPSAKDFKPLVVPKQVTHKLSDGGMRIQTVATKRSAQIKYKYIDSSFRNKLKTVFDLNTNFIFDAFGTMTSWDDETIFEAVWPGNFEFFKFSDNFSGAGFSGKIDMREVSN